MRPRTSRRTRSVRYSCIQFQDLSTNLSYAKYPYRNRQRPNQVTIVIREFRTYFRHRFNHDLHPALDFNSDSSMGSDFCPVLDSDTDLTPTFNCDVDSTLDSHPCTAACPPGFPLQSPQSTGSCGVWAK
ncbi:hypothetical protein EVAR_60506_1 [Eumeta japonica]|uniref:Uncharacterized protein n=1 Tax=Eumeta variegata TaxID=151549 RepID=A0A4C1ZNT3_EUMVA|nr:hypothetical protein EVAR_60506_1 [Eumeta japonica]